MKSFFQRCNVWLHKRRNYPSHATDILNVLKYTTKFIFLKEIFLDYSMAIGEYKTR